MSVPVDVDGPVGVNVMLPRMLMLVHVADNVAEVELSPLRLLQTNTFRAGREKQLCSFNVNSDETKTTPLLPFAISIKIII